MISVAINNGDYDLIKEYLRFYDVDENFRDELIDDAAYLGRDDIVELFYVQTK